MAGDNDEEACKRLAEAKTDRTTHEPWIRDVYKYCMPWRRRPGEEKQINDQDELFDATAIGALTDFASDMQTTFTPVDEDWLTVGPAQTLSKADAAMIADQLTEYQTTVFAEMRRSNLYEATQEAYPDLGLGTCSMNIQDLGDLTAPIHCQAVPITDLLIGRGVHGGLDFRAREIPAMKYRDLRANYPRARFDAELLGRIAKDPAGTVKTQECWWRLWDKRREERWQYTLMVDGKCADEAVFKGDGSCALIAARWKTDSTTAFGIGPLYVVLPTIKTLDQVGYLFLKALSFAVDPAGFFDNDSIINLDNGISPGDWIPRAVGSKVEWLKPGGDFDTTFFSQDKMQTNIKRSLYQDNPVQTGDTPPTAAQWMDQKSEVARRMGAPFGRMTTEWQIAIFQRFAYLLEKRGTIPKGIKLRGGKVRLQAQSPLVRAQRQQKVAVAAQLLNSGAGLLGAQMPLVVDGPKTFANFKKAVGDDLIELRVQSDADLQQLVQSVTGQQPGQAPTQ